jgi:hypothetical protein
MDMDGSHYIIVINCNVYIYIYIFIYIISLYLIDIMEPGNFDSMILEILSVRSATSGLNMP